MSWYEALAFTRWLMARSGVQRWLPYGWQVTLPSEAEWEKVERGGLQILERPAHYAVPALPADLSLSLQPNPDPRRAYTWAAVELTPERANYDESEINQTSSVGAYREAASVYGCEEMLGNVHEWTCSLRKEYPYDLEDGREQLQRGDMDWTIVRGGLWAFYSIWSRCAFRGSSNPDGDSWISGYRRADREIFNKSDARHLISS